MNRTLKLIQSVYRAVVPLSIRQKRLASRFVWFISKRLFHHDAIYDSDYFADIESSAATSAEAISDSIMVDFRPHTVVDVGCGTGALLEAFQRKGCQVLGLGYSPAALRYCRMRNLDVRKFDLAKDPALNDRVFDVAISMEVAEQPHAYWIAKFQALGFAYDEALSKRWSASWRDARVVSSWYHENLMIFNRAQELGRQRQERYRDT